MKRKCSMCGEYKNVINFRFMAKQNRYNAYCKDCERWYQHNYGAIRRAKMKDKKMEGIA